MSTDKSKDALATAIKRYHNQTAECSVFDAEETLSLYRKHFVVIESLEKYTEYLC